MKKVFFLILLMAASGGYLAAQTSVVYALPATVIEIHAEAVHECFTAGPYAPYARKYLGLEAGAEDKNTFFLKSIALKTAVEADAAKMYSVDLKNKNAAANFLRFSAGGLLVSPEQGNTAAAGFQFPHTAPAAFTDRGVETHIGSEKVTLYKNVQTENGFEKVATQQSQTVEKNPEKRAEEAARLIFMLRKKRIELITGEVDGAMSQDGLHTALAEIRRLEEEYLSLFLGKTTGSVQTAVFHVMPATSLTGQLYVAFRFSDTQGLLPANDVAGRPVTLALVKDPAQQQPDVTGCDKQPCIVYRTPAMVQARILDGREMLLQTRLPVYQLGHTTTFPASLQVR